MKKLFLKISIFVFTLFALTQIFKVDSFASTTVLFTAKLTHSQGGTAARGQQVAAYNYGKAYDILKKGNISEAVLNSNYWSDLQKKFPIKKDRIILSDDLTLGPDVKHSSKKAMAIIEFLYNSGNFSFLQFLNSTPINVSPTGPWNQTLFVDFTNDKGKTRAKLRTGPTVFVNTGNNNEFLGLVNITQITTGHTFHSHLPSTYQTKSSKNSVSSVTVIRIVVPIIFLVLVMLVVGASLLLFGRK